MKKIYYLLALSFVLTGLLQAQPVSGYMGKRFSVNVGYGFNPFLFFDVTKESRITAANVNLSYAPSYINNTYFPGISTRMFANVEFAFSEYKTVGIEVAHHNNVLIMQNPMAPWSSDFSYGVHKLTCNNIIPCIRIYKKTMSPAPIGNYVALGINYTMAKVENIRTALRDYPNSDMYLSDGKLNFTDFYLGFGRAFLIKRLLIFKLEMDFPYVLRCFPAAINLADTERYFSFLDFDNYGEKAVSKLISRKVSANNWLDYHLSIGIPF